MFRTLGSFLVGCNLGFAPSNRFYLKKIIDSMFIDNEFRKVFTTQWEYKIYEGIGTNQGLFKGINFWGDEAFNILMCYQHNDDVYDLYDGWTPDLMTVHPCEDFLSETAEQLGFSTFKISPNPASTHFQLAIGEIKQPTVLTIFAANGQLIQQRNIQSKIIEIDISNFRKGIYFIGIQNEQGSRFEKLIKL